jgi:hypothetical protein
MARGRVVTGLPELLASLLVGLEPERRATFRRGGFAGNLHIALDARFRGAELEEEGRGSGVVGAFVGVYGSDRAGVNQLDATDPHSCADHPYGGPSRCSDVREDRPCGHGPSRGRVKA